MVPCAYLRVYQRTEAFGASERARWDRYLSEGRRAPEQPRFVDRPTARGLGLLVMADDEHAEVLELDGITYVSPRSAQMRVLAAIISFHETEPIDLARRFVPTREARRAERALVRLRRRDPKKVSFVQESPWHAPVRWFVLFDDEERWLGNDQMGRLRLRHRTRVRKAMR